MTPSPRLPTPVAIALSTVLFVGLAVASWLVRVKLQLELDPGYVSSCNLGGKLNCDLVQTSGWSVVGGYPLALWAVVTYGFLLASTWLAARSERWGLQIHGALVVAGAAMCLHAAVLAYVSSFVIGAYCIYCITLYAVNLLFTALAAWSFRRRGGRLLAAHAFVAQPRALAALAALFGLATAAILPAYHAVRDDMTEARLAVARQELASAGIGAPPAATPSHAPAPGGVEPAPAPAPAAARNDGRRLPSGTVQPPDGAFGEVVTSKGRSFYNVPVTVDDFVLGPEDAPVTVVDFADFECGYCRSLTANFKPLKEKYRTEVRWVFKHFPLDRTCNPVMKDTQHPNACRAARAANCAGEQGRFWPFHDLVYERSGSLDDASLRAIAEDAGVDLDGWDACRQRPGADPKIATDSQQGRFARIAGTPRTYVNGHLLSGVAATEVLDYYIQSALQQARSPQAARPELAPVEGAMAPVRTAKGTSWIDRYEAALGADGRALSAAGLQPAEASWHEATAACEKAGKRLCTEEEWISACTSAPAVDEDGDGDFSDDAIQGLMFSYGQFHQGGTCNDDQPEEGGRAVATGSMPGCRSSAGVFDMSGNLAEWTGRDAATGLLSGADFRYGPKATCHGRFKRFGLGYRNNTTGFRCCADRRVDDPGGTAAAARVGLGEPGQPAPAFEVTAADGKRLTAKDLLGHVTIVSFFASWCGPCQRELPDLNAFYREHAAKGLRVLAIGVDTDAAAARAFVEPLGLAYQVAYDAEAISMGQFAVRGMPTAFLVDRQGVVRERLVGVNAEKVKAFKQRALELLGAP